MHRIGCSGDYPEGARQSTSKFVHPTWRILFIKTGVSTAPAPGTLGVVGVGVAPAMSTACAHDRSVRTPGAGEREGACPRRTPSGGVFTAHARAC